jgi:hypothetical protein
MAGRRQKTESASGEASGTTAVHPACATAHPLLDVVTMTSRSKARTAAPQLLPPVLVLLAASCGGASGGLPLGRDGAPSDGPGSIACGDLTCGPHQYCADVCDCCGIALPPDAGVQPSSHFECRDIPAGCSANDLCACHDTGGWPSLPACAPATRVVAFPCA